jgi:Tfp pilus assembly protein PilN
MMQSAKITKEQRKLDVLQARVAALPPAPSGPTAGATQLAGEHSARVTALASAMANRVAWDRIFREFSLVLPDDVKLTSMTLQAPAAPTTTGAPTSGAQGFSIAGSAFSHDGVARLLSRLMLIPDLQNVTLGNSSAGDQTNPGVTFTITASVKGAVAPAPPVPPATPPAATTTGSTS